MRYPAAQWRPLGPQAEPPLVRKNKIILHTMVGTLWGTDAFFREGGYGGTESHFGVGHDGTVFQWQDANHQADAQLEGNDDGLSIETADTGDGFPGWSGSNVPAWRPAQIDAIVGICVWACRTYDIPAVLIGDTADATRGIGYHRQGIDPWRRHGGEHYSESFAKVCPGDRRIKQLTDEVLPRVRAELTGDDDMAYSDWPQKDRDALVNDVKHGLLDEADLWPKGKQDMTVRTALGRLVTIVDALPKTLRAIEDGTSDDATRRQVAAFRESVEADLANLSRE